MGTNLKGREVYKYFDVSVNGTSNSYGMIGKKFSRPRTGVSNEKKPKTEVRVARYARRGVGYYNVGRTKAGGVLEGMILINKRPEERGSGRLG